MFSIFGDMSLLGLLWNAVLVVLFACLGYKLWMADTQLHANNAVGWYVPDPTDPMSYRMPRVIIKRATRSMIGRIKPTGKERLTIYAFCTLLVVSTQSLASVMPETVMHSLGRILVCGVFAWVIFAILHPGRVFKLSDTELLIQFRPLPVTRLSLSDLTGSESRFGSYDLGTVLIFRNGRRVYFSAKMYGYGTMMTKLAAWDDGIAAHIKDVARIRAEAGLVRENDVLQRTAQGLTHA